MSYPAARSSRRNRGRKESRSGYPARGHDLEGKVVSLQKFGALSTWTAFRGLFPCRKSAEAGGEYSRRSGRRPGIEVRIIRIGWTKDQIPEPEAVHARSWDTVDQTFFGGSVHTGRVVRLTKFGALSARYRQPHSYFETGQGKRINHPAEVLAVGQTLQVQVESTDREQKRVSLSLVQAANEEKPFRRSRRLSVLHRQTIVFGFTGDLLKFKEHREKKTK